MTVPHMQFVNPRILGLRHNPSTANSESKKTKIAAVNSVSVLSTQDREKMRGGHWIKQLANDLD